ncbi:hypothetical protein BDB01DRAFT_909904 [Pilobolus umbonatus]|nr:hypothetical protein BDB01DRAFT_909904 [Pilobolus umbonatus]
MKYVRALEENLRKYEGNSSRIDSLAEAVIEMSKKDNEDNNKPAFCSPNENEVKFPGGRKLIDRKSALPKDYADPNSIRKYKANIRAEKRNIERSESSIEDKKTVIINEKDFAVDQVEMVVEENIYVQKKRRRIDTGVASKFTLHPDINLNDLKDTFSPKGGGFWGFRAASYLVYGKESCYTFVKVNMMISFGKNKFFYKSKLGLDVKLTEAIITGGIDRTMSEIERADKNEKLPDVPLTHQNAMRAGIGHWFNTLDCSQILADTFDLPVCVYPDVAEEDSFSVT